MLEIEEFPRIPRPQVKESVVLDAGVGQEAITFVSKWIRW